MKEQILEELAQINAASTRIRNLLENEEPELYRNIKAVWVSDRQVKVTWETERTGAIDIEWDSPRYAHEGEFPRSVNMYLHLHNKPVMAEDGEYIIGLSGSDDDYFFRISDGDYVSEPVFLPAVEKEDDPIEEKEKLEIKDIKYYGLWDFYAGSGNTSPDVSWKADGEWPFNAGKSMAKNISQIVDAGLKAIPHGDVFISPRTNQSIESRVRDVLSWADSFKEHVPIIHFMDEPEQKGVTNDQMLHALNYARSRSNYKYAYTINTSELGRLTGNGKVDGYGDYDYIFLQVYPFRIEHGDIADTREALYSHLDDRLEQLREIAPDSKYFIVGQGFYSLEGAGGNHKWRKPPDDAPIWYAEWVSNQPDVEGLLYWRRTGSRNSYVMLEHPDFAEYRERIIEAYVP